MSYAFARDALDRAAEWREQGDELLRRARTADALWLQLRSDGAACMDEHGGLQLQSGDALAALPREWIFLGLHEGRPVFAATCEPGDEPHEHRWFDLRTAAATLDANAAAMLAYASAMCAWRTRHRYCGACGAPLQAEAGGHRLRCSGCGLATFPRTDPAIIVAVRDGERLLLGRQAAWPTGRYSTLAGFVEPGETVEAAVAREVREESGVVVSGARYAGSQPWPFPGSLMIGFEADADTRTITVGDELEDARWFDPDQFASGIAAGSLLLPAQLSIAHWLVARWYRDITGKALPAPP